MGKVYFDISVSLDGYVAGPNMRPDVGLGDGGEALHDWVVNTKAFNEAHGRSGGEEGPDSDVMEERVGAAAHVMGRRMFGGEGDWDNPDWSDGEWEGWGGDVPPFHPPVFVLTPPPREPLVLSDTTFNFVTDGIESAIEQARAAAGEKDVQIAGGASAIQQALAAGLLDEIQVSVAPMLLGGGTPLFGPGTDRDFELDRVVDAPGVTHLRYRVR